MSDNDNKHRLFMTVFTALVVLGLLSMCPWNAWTGGWLKNINPLADDADDAVAAEVPVDPELAALEAESAGGISVDTVTITEAAAERQSDSIRASSGFASDAADAPEPLPEDFAAPSVGGTVLVEDYSADGSGLARLASTLASASSRPVRIAMIGDSYIEGDILSQTLRSGLQERYGGSGVGYVGAWSQFPGFRSSVTQSGPEWQEKMIADMRSDDPWRTILGRYHTAGESAVSRFKGSKKTPHAGSWTRTRVLFAAPAAGNVKIVCGDSVLVSEHFEADPSAMQALTATMPSTSDVTVSSDIPHLKVAGIWLEGTTGVVLDNISLRGNSGLGHRRLSETATAQMRRWVDYDLIILEFGLNVASPGQKNYDTYRRGMTAVVNNLKALYPDAQILVMGAGDRAVKQNGNLASMATLPALIRAQRDVARATGSLFYDTREAMGGAGAAIDWHKRKLVNADYIHLNHRGGRELGEIILKSLQTSLP